MAGLDIILKEIRQDAETAADQIISKAQSEAEQILLSAQKEAEKRTAQIEEKTNAMTADLSERAKSAVELEKRKRILMEKQQIINQVIEEAKSSLSNLPDKEYFSVLLKLIKKFALAQKGMLVLSEEDLKRLPPDFEQMANGLLKESGGSVEIKKEPGRIRNGFLLIYGGIEENCTFDALFEAAWEDLQDEVHKLLFA